MTVADKIITFIESQIPSVPSGTHTVTVTQKAGPHGAESVFSASRKFAVIGSRYRLSAGEEASVFPPDLGTGGFIGDLPRVMLNRASLPWQRSLQPSTASHGTRLEADADGAACPWLAVLLFQGDELNALSIGQGRLWDLVPQNVHFLDPDDLTPRKETGLMPDNLVSYPDAFKLEYGAKPDDIINRIDIPADLFTALAPTAADLTLLAHVRSAVGLPIGPRGGAADEARDASRTGRPGDAENEEEANRRAFLTGNRLIGEGRHLAVLVSLEGMADCLPDGGALKPTQAVRLAALASWSFSSVGTTESLIAILKTLDLNPPDNKATLRLPGPEPKPDDVNAAIARQIAEAMTEKDAETLALDALAMGYVPLNHELRHAGHTVSWYRGPLLPFQTGARPEPPNPTNPDQLSRYNPATGMFDVSDAAAWQLGQLLGLQQSTVTLGIANWRNQHRHDGQRLAEHADLTKRLDGAFSHFLARRQRPLTATLAAPVPLLELADRLMLLEGAPFSYLVPDERMLPPESLRFFWVDPNWLAMLLAGLTSVGAQPEDDDLTARLRTCLTAALDGRRQRRRARWVATQDKAETATPATMSGLLLRSRAVSGWPDLMVNGYADDGENPKQELELARQARLGQDVMLCLFFGDVRSVRLHEHPGQLRIGFTIDSNMAIQATSQPPKTGPLRAVVPQGDTRPGAPLSGSTGVAATLRPERQVLKVAETAQAVLAELQRCGQDLTRLSPAAFGLELIKGVTCMLYRRNGGNHG